MPSQGKIDVGLVDSNSLTPTNVFNKSSDVKMDRLNTIDAISATDQSFTVKQESKISLSKAIKHLYTNKINTFSLIWFFVSYMILLTSSFLYIKEVLPALTAISLNALSFYALYIIGHDAAHDSVFNSRLLNNIIGRFSLNVLQPFFAYSAFKYIHLQHHRNTNETNEDPDMWLNRKTWIGVLYALFTSDIGYVGFYLNRLNRRPKHELIDILITFFIATSIFSVLLYQQLYLYILVLWLIPSRITIVALGLFLAYIPHHPHTMLQKKNPYLATKIIKGYEWLLSPIFLYQNYHLVHHLYPKVPFYKLIRAWKKIEQSDVSQIAKVVKLK